MLITQYMSCHRASRSWMCFNKERYVFWIQHQKKIYTSQTDQNYLILIIKINPDYWQNLQDLQSARSFQILQHLLVLDWQLSRRLCDVQTKKSFNHYCLFLFSYGSLLRNWINISWIESNFCIWFGMEHSVIMPKFCFLDGILLVEIKLSLLLVL